MNMELEEAWNRHASFEWKRKLLQTETNLERLEYSEDLIKKLLAYHKETWYIYHYLADKTPSPSECNCGAKYTSFPDSHYDWCAKR